MAIFAPINTRIFSLFSSAFGFRSLSLKTKLMTTLIPSVVIVLMITGYITYHLSDTYLDIALQRNVRVQTLALTHEINGLLDSCRRDLLYITQQALDETRMRDFLIGQKTVVRKGYRELAYISAQGDGHVFLVSQPDGVRSMAPAKIDQIKPNPFVSLQKAYPLETGEVWISEVLEVHYPLPTIENANNIASYHIIRFATPYAMGGDSRPGLLLLGLDVRKVRDVLSLYNSPKSPIWAYPRTPEPRFSYMFEPSGWILFQSEDVERKDPDLATYQVRSGFEGTLGKPGLSCAFRPASVNKHYWKMVNDIRLGKSDLLTLPDKLEESSLVQSYFLSYAPVIFTQNEGKPPIIYAGIAYIDRSRLPLAAGYKQLDVMLIITLSAIFALATLIYLLSRVISNPILRLSEAVSAMHSRETLDQIDLPYSGYETGLLINAVNGMISTMKDQMEEIRIRDETIRSVRLKQKAPIDEAMFGPLDEQARDPLPEILGQGPKIEQLKSDILKAARVDVDVLLVGETGTGKQLAAEAIHNHSGRASKPFIAINCGALDENLLLDALFGHVRGAFTEAKTERKGAFLEANAGTLFLDEIQAASQRVQQSLLRAIAVRKVKPLGSDREVDVDVRLVAATNADLSALIDQRLFREDLYFRLKVLTVHTPPLREHKESIPLLALYFLKRSESIMNKHGLGLSRGALVKMRDYDWPGNVRELINCITRAAVMVEGELIQATDINLEGETPIGTLDGPAAVVSDLVSRPVREQHDAPAREPGTPLADQPPAADRTNEQPGQDPEPAMPKLGMSPRQKKAFPQILKLGKIGRTDYQNIVGGDLPARTALYDLQDLVAKGLLNKVGRGPSTRYVVAAKP
ncbi:MAG: sigma 54-interacting transcriptional regulator [Desulfovibrionaceae bacterium]|nr:sigma 54-interacting transcriptional regulator [Desulfovibrionaceae bacterium]